MTSIKDWEKLEKISTDKLSILQTMEDLQLINISNNNHNLRTDLQALLHLQVENMHRSILLLSQFLELIISQCPMLVRQPSKKWTETTIDQIMEHTGEIPMGTIVNLICITGPIINLIELSIHLNNKRILDKVATWVVAEEEVAAAYLLVEASLWIIPLQDLGQEICLKPKKQRLKNNKQTTKKQLLKEGKK